MHTHTQHAWDGVGSDQSLTPPSFQCHKLNYGRRADCCKCGRAKGPDSLYPPHLYDDEGEGGGGWGSGRVRGMVRG